MDLAAAFGEFIDVAEGWGVATFEGGFPIEDFGFEVFHEFFRAADTVGAAEVGVGLFDGEVVSDLGDQVLHGFRSGGVMAWHKGSP
ncbi:hypothetical protein BFW38_11170 [Terasakiispira papahanaumokuakeensis]|uniref:Uncharacterized protein n=1 Tax=Terasakiispira papahanaumokuakeensis TaxID=197479 RepID=A0A1E2VAR3_9GAMM|nr:hypothetical protein BFW38_11170 [Terasakiispira papahanaumokuakeensis]